MLRTADIDADYLAEYKLQVQFEDADGNVIPAEKLPADLKVSFADSKGAFNADGTIKDKTKIGETGEITVVATVTSESAELNLSKEYKVTIVTAAAWANVSEANILFNSDVVGSVITLADTATLLPTVATTNGGTELKGDTAPSDWAANVKSVKSSDITVLTVNSNGTDVNLVPVSAGTATVTVTLNSGFEFTKEITVKAETRKPTTITTDEETLTLSSTVNSGSVKVKVLDQYGDPVKGATVYAHPAKTGATALVTPNNTSATDKKGEQTLSLTAVANAETSTDSVKLSTNSDATKDGLGSLTVEYAKAGNVASYGLRITSDSESKDATVDKYDATDDDLKLEFIGKDADGVVAAVYNLSDAQTPYTVTSSDASVATATVSSGKVNVKAVKAGTATITVKEGNITRATFEVTVTDSTPSVGTIELATNAKFAVKEDATYTLNDDALKALVKVGNYKLEYDGDVIKVLDDTNQIGTVEVISSNTSLVTVTDNKTVETDAEVADDAVVSLLFRLKDNSGEVQNVVALPLTIDNTDPEIKSVVATVNDESVEADLTNGITLEVPFESVTSKIVVTFSEAVNLPSEFNVLMDVNDGDVEAVYGTAVLSEDGKTVTITPNGSNGTAGIAEATVTFTFEEADETPITTFADLAGNEVNIPLITLTVGEDTSN